MRNYPFITVGQILQELKDEGLPITRGTFYRLEERLNLPKPKKTSGKLRWRVYTESEKNIVIETIKKEYNIE